MRPQSKAQDFEGNTVEDAIKEAVRLLGVSRENMQIKVVCEEQRGLFGMGGAAPAKIKVTIKEKKDH